MQYFHDFFDPIHYRCAEGAGYFDWTCCHLGNAIEQFFWVPGISTGEHYERFEGLLTKTTAQRPKISFEKMNSSQKIQAIGKIVLYLTFVPLAVMAVIKAVERTFEYWTRRSEPIKSLPKADSSLDDTIIYETPDKERIPIRSSNGQSVRRQLFEEEQQIVEPSSWQPKRRMNPQVNSEKRQLEELKNNYLASFEKDENNKYTIEQIKTNLKITWNFLLQFHTDQQEIDFDSMIERLNLNLKKPINFYDFIRKTLNKYRNSKRNFHDTFKKYSFLTTKLFLNKGKSKLLDKDLEQLLQVFKSYFDGVNDIKKNLANLYDATITPVPMLQKPQFENLNHPASRSLAQSKEYHNCMTAHQIFQTYLCCLEQLNQRSTFVDCINQELFVFYPILAMNCLKEFKFFLNLYLKNAKEKRAGARNDA